MDCVNLLYLYVVNIPDKCTEESKEVKNTSTTCVEIVVCCYAVQVIYLWANLGENICCFLYTDVRDIGFIAT